MSILIKGMKEPDSCNKCPLLRRGLGDIAICIAIGNTMPLAAGSDEKRADCPIINVQPHGRLIDADALPWIEGKDEQDNPVYLLLKNRVDVLPTIIPAEEGEK